MTAEENWFMGDYLDPIWTIYLPTYLFEYSYT